MAVVKTICSLYETFGLVNVCPSFFPSLPSPKTNHCVLDFVWSSMEKRTAYSVELSFWNRNAIVYPKIFKILNRYMVMVSYGTKNIKACKNQNFLDVTSEQIAIMAAFIEALERYDQKAYSHTNAIRMACKLFVEASRVFFKLICQKLMFCKSFGYRCDWHCLYGTHLLSLPAFWELTVSVQLQNLSSGVVSAFWIWNHKVVIFHFFLICAVKKRMHRQRWTILEFQNTQNRLYSKNAKWFSLSVASHFLFHLWFVISHSKNSKWLSLSLVSHFLFYYAL